MNSIGYRMQELLPDWEFLLNDVDYRDPYHPKKDINIFFCKHFRHAYQKEFRLVWKPSTSHESLKPLYLELGPLKDYCELLVL